MQLNQVWIKHFEAELPRLFTSGKFVAFATGCGRSSSPRGKGAMWVAAGIVILGSLGGLFQFETRAPGAELRRFEFSGEAMAAPVRLVIYAAEEADAAQAWQRAMARLQELNDCFSDYDPESELSRLCAAARPGKPVPVSCELWDVLCRAQEIAQLSDGAFDITVGPVVRLWRRARRQREFPDPKRLAEARRLVGYSFLRLHPETRSVELLREGMRLDLGGIAKGYAGDQVLSLLESLGFYHVLVDIGGDIRVGRSPPGADGWKVAVQPLQSSQLPRVLLLHSCAIATSGDTERFVILEGKRYSHIIDPRTGWAVTGNMSVTVVAPNGVTADALASAVRVLGPEKGIRLVEKLPGTACFIECVVEEGGDNPRVAVTASSGWEVLPQISPENLLEVSGLREQ
jgi:thiamine biosynthesis lipoprotein